MTASPSLQHRVHPAPAFGGAKGSIVAPKDGLESPPDLVHGSTVPSPIGPITSKSPSPDSVASSMAPVPALATSTGVPNPFAVAAAAAATNGVKPRVMTSWTASTSMPTKTKVSGPPTTKSTPVPLQAVYAKTKPVQIAASGIRVPVQTFAATPSPQASPLLRSSAPSAMQIIRSSQGAPQTTSTTGTKGDPLDKNTVAASTTSGVGSNLNPRRQKRLERNRESARLSRRRRKQYLEVLEDRVTQLSVEMDRGRREHAMSAVSLLQDKRRQALESKSPVNTTIGLLQNCLSRSSSQLRINSTFQKEQLVSLSLPLQTKFILWVTLQNDAYFRGGRAASERLSAARIGERMLQAGNDRVPPFQGMWPLFCNEVGLSYDQEERVRSFQKAMLTTPEKWLDRHSAAASSKAMQQADMSYQTLSENINERDRGVTACLNESQKLHLLSWCSKNKARLANKLQSKEKQPARDKYNVAADQHVAAKLYILHHKMLSAMKPLRKPVPLFPSEKLKRLSRRPLFESLGSQGAQQGNERGGKDENGMGLSRERSFSSTGSLKRSLSDMSCEPTEDSASHVSNITSEEAQKGATAELDRVLGHVKEIIPAPRAHTVAATNTTFSMPPPPVKQHHQQVPVAPPAAPISKSNPIVAPKKVMIVGRHTGQVQPLQSVRSAQPVPSIVTSANLHVTPTPVRVVHSNSSAVPPPTGMQLPKPVVNKPFVVPAPAQSQSRPIPSFLPPHLNVVPEEQYLPGRGETDDFLFELTEEDWAIGEGFDMDIS